MVRALGHKSLSLYVVHVMMKILKTLAICKYFIAFYSTQIILNARGSDEHKLSF